MDETTGNWFAIRNLLVKTSLLVAVITIPLANNINSWALVIFTSVAVITTPVKDSLNRLWKHRYWMLCSIFFLWLWASWFWDTSGGFSVKYVERYLMLPVLPIVFTILPPIPVKTVLQACFSFIVMIVVVNVICLIKSYIEYRHTGNSEVFFYHSLGYQMGLNAIYLSNYSIAAITWLIYYQFIYQGAKPFKLPVAVTLITVTGLVLMIFLLSSKLSLFVMLLLLLFFLIYIGYLKKKLYINLAILAIILAGSFLLINRLNYLKWRIDVTEFKAYSGPEDPNGLAARMITWQSAIALIKEKPLLGYGLKGATEEQVKQYKARNFASGVREKYHAHNQYFQTTLDAGVVGLALLLLLLCIPLTLAFRKNKLLLKLIILHFMLLSFVESPLEMQQELVFYWFFIYLLYYHYYYHSTTIQQENSH